MSLHQGEREQRTEADHDAEALQRPGRSIPLLYYVRPLDGKLSPLIIQSFQDARSLPETQLWTRLEEPPLSPTTTLGKMSYWIGAPILVPGSMEMNLSTGRAVGEAALRLVAAWPLSCFMIYGIEFLTPAYMRTRELGMGHIALPDMRYQPVRQMGHMVTAGETAAAAPLPAYTDDINLDDDVTTSAQQTAPEDDSHTILLETSDQGTASRPRYLCYIRDYRTKEFETVNVSQFLEREGDNVDIEFVFVSYTREQFRVATDEEIDMYTYLDDATREANRLLARRDRELLVQWGLDAAERAGKRAFWIDFECVRDKDGAARSVSKSDDVYRICDVVRASYSMIIATGPPASEKVSAILAGEDYIASASQQQATTKWLRQWGSRLWTLPELLLCPSEHRIKLYVLGQDASDPLALAKRNFAERAWDDAELVKELVNHYEGSAILSQIQLIETALECFSRRGTHQFSPGDIAYALMGLLPMSQRPTVHPDDTGFQAFARLSLANDGGEFLSRMVCLLPPEQRTGDATAWYGNVKDIWGARIRDVHPSSRVVKMATNAPDTLIFDSAHCAAITWDGFDLDVARRGEMPTKGGMVLVFAYSVLFSITCLLFLFVMQHVAHVGGLGLPRNLIPMVCLGVFGLPALLMPPLYLWAQRDTHPREMKAELVGIEGHVDAGTIEKHLWGYNHGRLTQIDGTPDERQDSQSDSDDQPATQPRPKESEDSRFTLVDTHMMTVTHITAAKPPVALLVVGSAGGAQRALLCSYDWRDDTFEREAMLRIKPRMLEQMRRMDQFRLRLHSGKVECARDDKPEELAKAVAARETPSNWHLEMLFIIITMLAMGPVGERRQYVDIAYASTIIAMQVPTFFLMSRVSLARLLPQLVLLKGSLPAFLHLDKKTYAMNVIAQVVYGIVEGALYPALIVILWSWWWRSASTFALRALLFTAATFIIPPLVRRNVNPHDVVRYWSALLWLMFHWAVAMMGRQRIGRPQDVSWTTGAVRARLAQRIKGMKLLAQPGKQVVPLVLFAVVACAHLGTDGTTGVRSLVHAFGLLLVCGVLVLFISVARHAWKVTIVLLVAVIAISSLGTAWSNYMEADVGLTARILVDTRFTILPLTWVLANSLLDTPSLQVQTFCLSLAGMAVGTLIQMAGPVMNTYRVQAPASVAAISLLAGLAVYKQTRHPGAIALV